MLSVCVNFCLFWLVTWLLAGMLCLVRYSINSQFFWGVILFPCNGMHRCFIDPWCLVIFFFNCEISKMTAKLHVVVILSPNSCQGTQLAWYTISLNHRDIVSHSEQSKSILDWRHFRTVLPHSCTLGWCNEIDFSERLCAW